MLILLVRFDHNDISLVAWNDSTVTLNFRRWNFFFYCFPGGDDSANLRIATEVRPVVRTGQYFVKIKAHD